MTDNPASKALTESLMGVVRQQRHYGVRVIISTQEPTISPKLIDLCSVTVIHRFSSPEWFSVLQKHIFVSDQSIGDKSSQMLREIMNLETGEAFVFAPSAMITSKQLDKESEQYTEGLIRLRVRRRITWDGGKSIVCV